MEAKKEQKEVDFGSQVWLSLLRLISLHEYIFTVDHSSLWRQHLAWAKEDGAQLRNHLTQRFASSMVFMSLILSGQLMVLFNSNHLQTLMRTKMMSEAYGDILYWIGVVITVSVFLTFFTLITNFTAWGMVSAISDNNAHCLLRSSIGLYVTQLPSRLVTVSIYSFLIWITMITMYLLPGPYMTVLFIALGLFFFHIVAVFSAFGRLILHTGAMGSQRIFDQDFEDFLMPTGLHISLLIMALEQRNQNWTVPEQYKEQLSAREEENDDLPLVPSTDSKSPPKSKEEQQNYPRVPSVRNDSYTSVESDIIRQNVMFLNRRQSSDLTPPSSPNNYLDSSPAEPDHTGNDRPRVSFETTETAHPSSPRLDTSITRRFITEVSPRFSTESVLARRHQSIRNIRQSFVKAGYSLSASRLSEDVSKEGEILQTVTKRNIRSRRQNSLRQEWERESQARNMYHKPPPEPVADFVSPPPLRTTKSKGASKLPSPSILNKANLTFKSIRRVTTPNPEEVKEDLEKGTPSHLSLIPETLSFEHSIESEKSEKSSLLNVDAEPNYTDEKEKS